MGESDVDRVPCPWCDAPMVLDWSQHRTPKCDACGKEPVVAGKFRISKLLGRGGMGVVYGGKAIHDKHLGQVAVKIIAPPSNDDWTAWELFERSSRVLQHLQHPSLPKVYAFERTDTGRLVLVREPFHGRTLQERIAQDDERVSPERLRALLEQMLKLLQYLQGLVPPVIHRDVKPSNVMFRTRADWDPVLVDFDTVVSRPTGLTIVGTPGYAAPEQFAADASPASDVYGLGATMLFVATHTDADELPHEHGRFVLDGLLPSLDSELVSVLARMVEPDISKRYATARDVLDDLHKPAPPPSPKPKPSAAQAPATKSHRWWPWLLGPALLAGACWMTVEHALTSDHTTARANAPAPPALDDTGEKACANGDGDACFNVAWRYDQGNDGVTKDYARAARFYDRACTLGSTTACNNLGVDYEKGYGVDADAPRAAKLYQGACDAKNGLACRNLASLYQGDGGAGVPRDLAKAFASLSRGCDLRDAQACNNLGWAYEAGLGTRQDLKKAANLYGLACDLGDLWGCRNSGIAYETADGVERDEQRAVVLLERACGDDEKGGCLELGRMTLDGRGTEKDPARAADAFDKGCDDGWLEACGELAKLYAAGRGVKKNAATARRLFGRACDGGIEDSCGQLRRL